MSTSEKIRPETIDYSTRTYGQHALAEQIDGSLDLSTRVADLVSNPTILNVGAGPYVGVNALIRAVRPDATIISIDPGYSYPDTREAIPLYEEDEAYVRSFLLDGKVPEPAEEIRIASLAENLPFQDNTFYFIFGHASVPECILPDETNRVRVLGELSRVAKTGTSITLGLHMTQYEGEWALSVAKARRAGLFADASILKATATIKGHGMTIHGFRTELTR